MKDKILLGFALLMLISCNKTTQPGQNQSDQTSQGDDQAVQTPASMNATQELLLTDKSVIFNEAFIKTHYADKEGRTLTTAESNRYKMGSINETPAFSVMDSIRFNDDVWMYFVKAKTKYGFRVFLTNYSSKGDYIGYRTIFSNTAPPEQFHENVYSRLSLPEGKIIIYDNNTILNEIKEIPINIGSKGEFSDFPDVPFEKGKFAAASCDGGLDGKQPLNEKWTVVNFEHEIKMVVETTNNYSDYVESYKTLYTPETVDGTGVVIDIAFKGEYKDKDIQTLPTTYKKDYNKVELEALLEKSDDIKKKLPPCNITEVYSFNHNGEYLLIHYTSKKDGAPYTFMVGVTPDKKVQLLGDRCLYNYYPFRLKDEVMFYIKNTSCGEGAEGITKLYKIKNTGFEKIFDKSVPCD